MATIKFNDESSIIVNLSNESSSVNTTVKDLNYIPEYKKYEEERQINENTRNYNESIRISNEIERQSNETEREKYIENFKADVESGKFAGTTNYNDLSNIPITNLVGTEDNPVILLDLESGLYKLSGKVKKHATEEYTSSLNSVIMVKKIASNNIRYIDLNPGYSSDYSSYLLNITELKYNEENGLTIKGGVIRDSNYVETIIDDKIQSAIGNALGGSY